MKLIVARGEAAARNPFLRFAFVGTLGLCVNECVLYLALHFAGSNKYEDLVPCFRCCCYFYMVGEPYPHLPGTCGGKRLGTRMVYFCRC